MLPNTPKPSELIHAQIATFAAERIAHCPDSTYIFAHLGDIAVDSGGGVTGIATAREYVDFLRSVGGSGYEPVRGRADMLKAYSRFRHDITSLKSDLTDSIASEDYPAYLGSGDNAVVFRISVDGIKYAVRIPKKSVCVEPKAIDSHLAGAVLGRGVPHLEQIVAASYEDGVTVSEIMPGKEVGELYIADVGGIGDEQLGDLVDTLITVHARGIEIDPKPSNVFYHPESGYGIVDYHSSKVASKTSADASLGEKVGWMTGVILQTGFYGQPAKATRTINDYAYDAALMRANLDVLRRYRVIVDNKLAGQERSETLAWIDTNIGRTQATVDEYANRPTLAASVVENWQGEYPDDLDPWMASVISDQTDIGL